MCAVLAALDMTAERSRPANLDRSHDASLGKADVGGIGRAPRLTVDLLMLGGLQIDSETHCRRHLSQRDKAIFRAPPL
jgi:hypothetical protein